MRQGLPAGLIACTSVKTPLGVIRTIILMGGSVKYRFPSGPAVIACGWALAVGTVNSVSTPLVVTRPMMLSNLLTNHRLSSGPVVMLMGPFGPVTGTNRVKFPATSMRPIIPLIPSWQNHSAPSGPSVIAVGPPLGGITKKVMIPVAGSSLTMELKPRSVNQISPSGVAAIPVGVRLFTGMPPTTHGWPPAHLGTNPVNTPLVVTLPIPSGKPDASVNHSAPSAPATISVGAEPDCGTTNSVIVPCGSMRPIWLAAASANHILLSGPRVMPSGWLLLVGIRNDLNLEVPTGESNVWAPTGAAASASERSATPAESIHWMRNPCPGFLGVTQSFFIVSSCYHASSNAPGARGGTPKRGLWSPHGDRTALSLADGSVQ